jgi:transposase
MSKKITATHERVDDIPAILAHLKKMGVAELLDQHFLTNGNWQGLSLGWTTVVWLAFILSEGDHRLSRVEPWVKAHQRTLSGCIARKVRPRDLAEDRLATILDDLSDTERWGAFARVLNQSVLRVCSQAAGQHRSRRASADDNHIIFHGLSFHAWSSTLGLLRLH